MSDIQQPEAKGDNVTPPPFAAMGNNKTSGLVVGLLAFLSFFSLFLFFEWRMTRLNDTLTTKIDTLSHEMDTLEARLLMQQTPHIPPASTPTSTHDMQQTPETHATGAESEHFSVKSADNIPASERTPTSSGKNMGETTATESDTTSEKLPAVSTPALAAKGTLFGRILVLNSGHMRAFISAGMDKDLTDGQQLSVWRDHVCTGEIRVVRKYADMTVCDIVSEFQGGIRVSDQVRGVTEKSVAGEKTAAPLVIQAKSVE